MLRPLRPYLVALLVVWFGLGIAVDVYGHRFPAHLHWIMQGVLPAFLFEAVFFVAAGFEQTRRLFSQIPSRPLQSALLWASSLPPYLLIAGASGLFQFHALLILLTVTLVMSFWWLVCPRGTPFDILFLIFAAAVVVSRLFYFIYASPIPHFDISILGHVMWIRLTLTALLVQRRFDLGPVTFWPRLREWREGLLQFALAILPLSALALSIRLVTFPPKEFSIWQEIALALGYFFGTLWVVAFSEDVFRSVITRLFLNGGQTRLVAVIGSGLLIGCTHLWFHSFPNWRFALLAAVAHMFYSTAYVRANSVRASMVTHALTVTAWRLLFRS